MPYHFVRRAGVLALAATMVVPQAGALSDVSSWAQEDIAAAQQAGLMPTSLADSSAREEITRAEFCAIAVKAYKQLTGKAVYASGQKFFRDTDDANVNAAYSLGLVTAALAAISTRTRASSVRICASFSTTSSTRPALTRGDRGRRLRRGL